MFISTDCTHLENKVLQARSLSRRPMNTSDEAASWDAGHIEHQVPDLSVEDICRNISWICGGVFISVDKRSNPTNIKSRRRLQDGHWVVKVANQVCHIVQDNWL